MTDVIRDVEWIRNYLVGRLSEAERIAFEDRLARDPTLVREFEQSLRLRDGLRELQARGYFAAATPNARNRGTTRLWYWLRVPAAAAIVGAALVVAWRVNHQSPVLTAMPTSGAAPLIAAQFTFVSWRDGKITKLTVPSSGLIELRAAPDARTAESYRVTLIRSPEGRAAQRVGVISRLPLGADGYVHCYADSSRLGPGSYGLRIEPEGASPLGAQVFLFVLEPPRVAAPP
jgi:anti-sigma factor RsiW